MDYDRRMDQMNWKVEVHGDRVVVMFPLVQDGEDVGYVFDTSPDGARELAEAISTAANEARS
jgi:hypothetical protein